MPPKNKNEQVWLKQLIEEQVVLCLANKKHTLHEVDLYQTFVQPFADVVDTAKHGIQSVASTTVSNLSSLIHQTALWALPYVPGLTDAGAMAKVDKNHSDNLKARIESLNSQYKDVLDRNWDTLVNSDLGGLMFMANPQLVLGAKLLGAGAAVGRQGAIEALQLIDMFSGGSDLAQRTIGWLQQPHTSYGAAKARAGGGSYFTSSGHGDGGMGQGMDYGSYADAGADYGGLYEQQAQSQPSRTAQQPTAKSIDYKAMVQKILNDPRTKQAMASSQTTATMQAAAVSTIVNNAKRFLKFSYQDLKGNAGSNYQEFLKAVKQNPKFSNVDIDKNIKLQEEIVKAVKELIKNKFATQLKTLGSSNTNLQPTIQQAIKQISAL